MGILREGIRELLHNFTSPINDSNAPVEEVSSDNLAIIAKKSGMSEKDIAELLKSSNGIEVAKAKKNNKVGQRIEEVNETNNATRSQVLENEEKGIER